MYSFAQRADMSVIDEPFYGYYLRRYPVTHPGNEDILKAMPQDLSGVTRFIEKAHQEEHLFIKGMAHHLLDTDLSIIEGMVNLILIRDPKQLIASFAQVIPNPTMQDIGVSFQHDLFTHLTTKGQRVIVLDSGTLLQNPKACLSALCAAIGIPFDTRMLTWKSGALKEDGIWAKHWYNNVHSSTGFKAPPTSQRPLPRNCKTLYKEAIPYYDALRKVALAISPS